MRCTTLMSLSLLLVGCTGGKHYEGIDATETGEGVPPVILATTPDDGAADVSTGLEISIEFSEPIDPDSVTTESLGLATDDGREIPTVTVVDEHTVTLVPEARLDPDASYRVEIADTVRDLEGDTLASPYSFGFSTSGGWEEPMRLVASTGLVHLAADSAAGHAVVLWVVGACESGCAGDYTLYAATYSSDGREGAFTPALTVAGLSTNPITSIAVTIDDSGAATAVWSQRSGTYYSVFASRLEPGGSAWSSPGLIETENLGNASRVRADATADGVVHVAWEQRNASTTNVWANRYESGAGWAGAELLEASPEDAVTPAIVALGDGGAIAVWSQAGLIRTARLTGDTWTSANISHSASDFRLVALAGDRVLVAWIEAPVAFSLYDGAGWSTPENVDPGVPDQFGWGFDLAGVGDGAVIVWTEGMLSEESVYQARFDGVTWDATDAIENLSGPAFAPDVASGPDRAMAVWRQRGGATYAVYAVEHRLPVEWRAPEVASDPRTEILSPLVLYDARTNIFLSLWVQDDGLYWNRYQ